MNKMTVLLTMVALAVVASGAQSQDAGQSAIPDFNLASRVTRFEHGLRRAARGPDTIPERWNIHQRMQKYKIPGVSIAVLRGGQVVWAKGYGVRNVQTNEPIDPQTLFSVGSLSKTGTALTALRLVADGKLDLDRDVNDYLTSWKVPPSAVMGNRTVTIRGLLSHTAGTSVHGFGDFQPDESLPTTVQTLDGVKPAKNKPIRVVHRPGTLFDYSGGGTTIVQLAITDVMELSYDAITRRLLFDPLGMTRSTYQSPLYAGTPNVAMAHNARGQLTAQPRGWESFPENGASGLWSTPTEYATMLAAMIRSYHGEPDSFLPRPIAIDAFTEVRPGDYGLGPRLTGSGRFRMISHGGANQSYKAIYEVLVDQGDGAVIFTNGANGASIRNELLRSLSDAFGWDFHREIITVDLSSDHLSEFVGTYSIDETRLTAADDAPKVVIDSDGSALTMIYRPALSWRAIKQPLYAVDPSLFTLGHPTKSVEFQRGTFGGVDALSWTDGGRIIHYNKDP